jgi:hypothetical protein
VESAIEALGGTEKGGGEWRLGLAEQEFEDHIASRPTTPDVAKQRLGKPSRLPKFEANGNCMPDYTRQDLFERARRAGMFGLRKLSVEDFGDASDGGE